MDTNKIIQDLANCIEACGTCTTGCLNSPDVEKMKECILTNLDCSDVCSSAILLISRKSPLTDEILRSCIEITRKCEEECRKHDMDHCQACAEACQQCIETCESYASVA